MDLANAVNIITISFNGESIEVVDLHSASGQTKGNFKLKEKFIILIAKTQKEHYLVFMNYLVENFRYEPIESTNLLTVFYFYDQLNFNPNCLKKKDDSTQLKSIVLNDKRVEVEDLDGGVISSKDNLKSKENFLFYCAKSTRGKFVYVYKVTVGEIEVSQTYESIAIKNPPVVEYSFNELEYKANSSLHLNSFTHLREITFKDGNTKFTNLERSKFKAIGRLKLVKTLLSTRKEIQTEHYSVFVMFQLEKF